METINDRIEQIINSSFSGNKIRFAEIIGVPSTSMSNYFSKQRRSKIPVDMVEKIVRILKIDAHWLITGEQKNQGDVHTEGDYSPASGTGNVSVVAGDAVLSERIKSLEELLAEKNERIAELKERIEELKNK